MKLFLCFLFLFSGLGFAEEVKILAWNVYMLPRPIKFSKQEERLPLIIAELKKLNHDVIVLEEAFWEKFRTEMGEELKSTYPYQHGLGKSGSFSQVMTSGVFILSRRPFEVVGSEYYKECKKADCYASKGVLMVRFPGFQLAATHMQSGQADVIKEIRKTQLLQVRDFLKKSAVEKIPQLLVGDLNINGLAGNEYDEALRILDMRSTPLDGPLTHSSANDISCFENRSERLSWIDHMFEKSNGSLLKTLSKNIRMIKGPIAGKTCDLSDHHAIEGIFSL
jgi:exonuclease III